MNRTSFSAALIAAHMAAAPALAADNVAPAGTTAPHPPHAGIIETATVFPGNLKLKAKLDTGARTSSLGVTQYRLFSKGSRDMVAFSVRRADGTVIEMTRPLLRITYVKERGRESTGRPVVQMTICVGNLVRQTQVNLQNRENFNYTLLIGRRYLAGAYAVDPARRNILRTDCPAAKDIVQ